MKLMQQTKELSNEEKVKQIKDKIKSNIIEKLKKKGRKIDDTLIKEIDEALSKGQKLVSVSGIKYNTWDGKKRNRRDYVFSDDDQDFLSYDENPDVFDRVLKDCIEISFMFELDDITLENPDMPKLRTSFSRMLDFYIRSYGKDEDIHKEAKRVLQGSLLSRMNPFRSVDIVSNMSFKEIMKAVARLTNCRSKSVELNKYMGSADAVIGFANLIIKGEKIINSNFYDDEYARKRYMGALLELINDVPNADHNGTHFIGDLCRRDLTNLEMFEETLRRSPYELMASPQQMIDFLHKFWSFNMNSVVRGQENIIKLYNTLLDRSFQPAVLTTQNIDLEGTIQHYETQAKAILDCFELDYQAFSERKSDLEEKVSEIGPVLCRTKQGLAYISLIKYLEQTAARLDKEKKWLRQEISDIISDLKEQTKDLKSLFRKLLEKLSQHPEEYAELHDYLLPVAIRLENLDMKWESVVVQYNSHPLVHLDSKNMSGRCTSGRGMFRKTSLQYLLDENITIIDLCLKKGNYSLKIADAVIIKCKDKDKNDQYLVEVVEAGPLAELLLNKKPEAFDALFYKEWISLLYVGIVKYVTEDSKGKCKPLFNLERDRKPNGNKFYQFLAQLAGQQKITLRKYEPSIGKRSWFDYLITPHTSFEGQELRLEKPDSDELKKHDLSPLMYLAAFTKNINGANSFECIPQHHYINNGKGNVRVLQIPEIKIMRDENGRVCSN